MALSDEAVVRVIGDTKQFRLDWAKAQREVKDIAVLVSANTKEFVLDIERAAKQAQPLISARLDVAQVRRDFDEITKNLTVTITGAADTTAAKAEFDALIRPLTTPVSATADVAAAMAELETLSRALTVPVLASADVAGARSELEALARTQTVPFVGQADVGAARAEIEALSSARTVTIVAQADVAAARAEIEALASDRSAATTATGRAPDGGGGGGSTGAVAAAGLISAPAAVVTAGVVATVATIKTAEDYVVAIRRVTAEQKLSEEQAEQLRALTIELGNDQALGAASAGDAADAFLVLARAGLTFEQAIGATRSALQAAIISEQDVTKSTEQFGAVLNATRTPASEAIALVNELAKTDELAAGPLSELIDAITRASPAFIESFGPESRQEMQATLAALSQVGVIGPKAGYGLAQLAKDAARSTKAEGLLTEALKKKGIALEAGSTIFKDSQGNVREFAELTGLLDKALAGTSAAERAELTKDLGDETKQILPALLSKRDAILEGSDAIEAEGEAKELADRKSKALATTSDALNGALETAAILIGEKLLPAYDALGGKLAEGISWVGQFVGALDFGSIIDGARDALSGFDLGSFGEKITGALSGIRPALDRISTAVRTAFTPEQVVAFRKVMSELLPVVIDLAKKVGGLLVEAIELLSAFWREFGDEIIVAVGASLKTVAAVVGGIVDVIRGVVTIVTGILEGDWSKAWEGVELIVSGVVDAVKGVFGGLKEYFSVTLGAIKDFLAEKWDEISNGAGEGLKKLPGLAGEALVGLRDILGRAFTVAWEWAKTESARVFGLIVDFVKGVPGKVLEGLGDMRDKLGAAFALAWDFARTKASEKVGELVTDAKALASRLKEALTELPSTLITALGDAWNAAKTSIPAKLAEIAAEAGKLPGLILGGLAKLGPDIATALTTAIGAGKTALEGAIKGLVDVAGRIGEVIVGAIKGPINGVIDLINGMSISIPGFDTGIPGVPSFDGVKIEFPDIPRLARGAIISRPQLAVFGEDGTEAAIPLGAHRSKEFRDLIAAPEFQHAMDLAFPVRQRADKTVGPGIDYDRLAAAIARAMPGGGTTDVRHETIIQVPDYALVGAVANVVGHEFETRARRLRGYGR